MNFQNRKKEEASQDKSSYYSISDYNIHSQDPSLDITLLLGAVL